MTSNLTIPVNPRKTENACCDVGLEEKLQPLLQELLAGVRRHHETTLLAGFDGHRIVASALCSLTNPIPRTALNLLRNMNAVRAVFNRVVQRTVHDQPDRPDARICLPFTQLDSRRSTTTLQQQYRQVTPWLAGWLEQFCMVMNEVHPSAVEVVILRIEGCDNRQIARRRGLPFRLVKRIVDDVHRACAYVVKR